MATDRRRRPLRANATALVTAVVSGISLLLAAGCSFAGGNVHGASSTSTPRGGAATASGPTSSTASDGVGTEPGLADGDARAITADVDRRERQALGARSGSGADAAEAGSLLKLTLGRFQLDASRHRKRTAPAAAHVVSLQIPVAANGASPTWFEATHQVTGDPDGAQVAALYEKPASGTVWHKTMSVPLSDGLFPDWDVTGSAAQPGTAQQVARASRDLALVARYLRTGKRPNNLALTSGLYTLRDHLRVDTKEKKWRSTSLRCLVPSRPRAVIGSDFGVSFLGDVYCDLDTRAKGGFLIRLRHDWAALAPRTSGLRLIDTKTVVELAVTHTPHGQVQVSGALWADVSVQVA